jgi:ParB family chromosome partitioning protein
MSYELDSLDDTPQPVEILSVIDISKIRLSSNQPRKHFDEDSLDELANSIREYGVLEPLIVRPVDEDTYELVAGERRFRAGIQAGLHSIPAVVRVLDDLQSLEVALIENLQREDIRPLECAQAYRRLIDEFGMTQEEVAERVGKKRPTITNTLRLLNLPPQVLESLDKDEITEGHARALLSVSDADVQIQVWGKVVAHRLSVRATERLCRNDTKASKTSVARETRHRHDDPNLIDVEDKLRRFLGTKVSINRLSNSRGRIEIEFYDDEDLMRILDLMSQS